MSSDPPALDPDGPINSMIAEAAGLSARLMESGSAMSARQAAHLVAAQTAALAVQDAAAHLRNVRTISAAARATVIERIARDPTQADALAPLVAAAEAALRDAEEHVERTGRTARRLIDRFDPDRPEPGEVANGK